MQMAIVFCMPLLNQVSKMKATTNNKENLNNFQKFLEHSWH
jgi:hypothetical protein